MVLHLFVRTIALNVALYLGSSFATKYGKDSIASYTIAINIWFLFAFFVDGYASAGNILAGKLYGAKAYEKLQNLGKQLTKYSIVLGLIIAAISFVLYYPIGRIFIEDQAVLDKFYSIFWIVLLMQPINGIAFIFDGIFKGMGYMKYLRNVLLIATFFGFLPVILIADYYQLELFGIWIAFVVWMFLRGGILLLKFGRLSIFNTN
jgi:Na+-driven multidrug efflux pump